MSAAPSVQEQPPVFEVASDEAVKTARAALDAHTVEMMAWHFHRNSNPCSPAPTPSSSSKEMWVVR